MASNVIIERSPMKYGTCVSCNERIYPGQTRLIVDESQDGGKKNATYCLQCERNAKRNNLVIGSVVFFRGKTVKVCRNFEIEPVSILE